MARAASKPQTSKSTPKRTATARTQKVKTKSPVKKPQESRQELLGFYKDMLLIRRFEEKAGQLYGQGQIAGFCHLYIGQEAVVVGMQANLAPGDSVITMQ